LHHLLFVIGEFATLLFYIDQAEIARQGRRFYRQYFCPITSEIRLIVCLSVTNGWLEKNALGFSAACLSPVRHHQCVYRQCHPLYHKNKEVILRLLKDNQTAYQKTFLFSR